MPSTPDSVSRGRRLLSAALGAVLVLAFITAGSVLLAAPAQAATGISGGPSFAAFDEQGLELNVTAIDVFGSDGRQLITGSVGTRSYSWIPGPDGIDDHTYVPATFFIDAGRGCEPDSQEYPYTNPSPNEYGYYGGNYGPCWQAVFNQAGGSPGSFGSSVPMATTGLAGEPLVFDRWEVEGADLTGCWTGDVGEVIPGRVGYKARLSFDGGAAPSNTYAAKAVYASQSPDTSAPVVTIRAQHDCMTVQQGAVVAAHYACVDPGAVDPAPACVGEVAVGEPMDTSTVGAHTFSVTGTDAAGNTRTNEIDYTVVPVIPGLSVSSMPIPEGDSGSSDVTFTASLSRPTTVPVAVDYATADGTAVASSDYLPRSGTLTFAPGETTATFVVPVSGDTTSETDESFTIDLTNEHGLTLPVGVISATITNDDAYPTMTAGDGSVSEGDAGTSILDIPVTLSNGVQGGFYFQVDCRFGDATEFVDYRCPVNVVVGSDGETEGNIEVVVYGDTDFEADETFTASLTWFTEGSSPGAPLGHRAAGSGTIRNDDSRPAPSVTVERGTGQSDPTDARPVVFEVAFTEPVTGFASEDVHLGGSTAGGTLSATVSGGPSVYGVSVAGMTTAGTVVASVPAAAANGVDSGLATLSSTSVDNSVDWVPPPKQAQTITFAQPYDQTFGDPPVTLEGTASSGLPVTYRVAETDDACSVSGATLIILHAGTCTVTATQEGDDQFEAATPVTHTFRIRSDHVTLFLSGPDTLAYGERQPLSARAHHDSLPSAAVVTSLTPALCDVADGRVRSVGALASEGTCTVELSAPSTRDVSYSSSRIDIDLVRASQSITFAALPDRTFGESDFDVSASSSSGLTVTFTASGDCAVTGSTVSLTAAGSCTVTAGQAGDTLYEPAADVSRTFAISPAVELSTPAPVQYSDVLALSATVDGAAGAVDFDLDGADFCSAAVSDGIATCNAPVSLPAGTYDVVAAFTPDDTDRGSGSARATATITAEDAEIGFTGAPFTSTGSSSATSATVALTAHVNETGDTSLGDITKAKVVFDLYKSTNFGGTPDQTVTGMTATDGTVSATTALPSDNYIVIARLLDADPTYYSGPASDAAVITVYTLTTGVWANGGGWVIDPGTNDTPVAISTNNPKGSFGFSIRYKTGTTPQGQSVYVFHGADGYDYVVKSNSWKGGGATFTKTTTRGATGFSAKASVLVFDPTTGATVPGLGGGNFTFRVDAVDAGKTDTYAISVYNAKGKLYHQVGTTRAQRPLMGGNITVHN